jgi:hypothetical protein
MRLRRSEQEGDRFKDIVKRVLFALAIVAALAGVITLHYAKARTDADAEIIARNAESRLHSIITALETGSKNVEATRTNNVIESVLLWYDKELKMQGGNLFKMPIVKEEVWVSINPSIDSWRHPPTNTNDIAAYWDLPLRTNNAIKEYLGMTFDLKAIWLTNFPAWVPVPLKNNYGVE